jgi:hypothetical protein
MLGDTLGDADHYATGDHEAASGLADQTLFSRWKTSYGNQYRNRLTPGEADESRGQGQMYINQACLR